MTKFCNVQLGEVAAIRGGKRLPLGADFSIEPTNHPYIRARDIGKGKVEIHDPVFITKEVASKLSRYTVKELDICLTIVGANVGDMGSVPSHLDGANLTENAVKIVSKGQVVQNFLKYALLNEDAARQMKVLAGGAAQPKLGIYKVETIEIPLPSVILQSRIVDVLLAYDNLIENNQRRIRILEEMARSLYREWFVHFRFPGHENHPRVPSSLGEIPQGWTVKQLIDVCKLTMGQSPKSEFYNDTGDGIPFHQGVSDFGDRFPKDRLFCTAKGRMAEAGDILFSVRAPVGRMNIASKRLILGRGLSAIRRYDELQGFLWEQLRDTFKTEDMIGNGAIFASVTKDDMRRIEMVSPPIALVSKAEEMLSPLHNEIAMLVSKNENLRRTRDLLLPRLLSGQIKLETN